MLPSIIAGAKEGGQIKRGHSSLSRRRIMYPTICRWYMTIFVDHDIEQAKTEVNIWIAIEY